MSVFTLHPDVPVLQDAGVPFFNTIHLPVADHSIQVIDVFLLTLHLNFLNSQLPFHFYLVVQFALGVFVYFKPVEVDLNKQYITASMFGH